ncbi:hypothetical protein D3C71_2201610 [compost metagenome]
MVPTMKPTMKPTMRPTTKRITLLEKRMVLATALMTAPTMISGMIAEVIKISF